MLWSFEVSRNQKLFLDKNHISNKNYIRKMDNDWDNCHLKKTKNCNTINNKMFLVVSISGSSEFCSDAKGSIYTLHVEYCKHHRSFHMCGINKQVRFLKKLIKSYALKYDFPERT